MQLCDLLVNALLTSPLLLLFVVIGVGHKIGQLPIGNFRLGIAAVLFVGLAFGALHPDLRLPEIVYQLGLVLFVYAVGLTSGPDFFAAVRQDGLRDVFVGIGLLAMAAVLTGLVGYFLELPGTIVAGIYAGSLTNTPALAAVIESLRTSATPITAARLSEPVVGYSLTYPFGVIGIILAIHLSSGLWKVDFEQETRDYVSVLGKAESPDEAVADTELNLPVIALGISLGLMLGLLPIPLPGGITLRLGFAGGPLIVALILGRLGRTGPIAWTMPTTINQTLRHLGIALFLAGIGTRSGHDFAATFKELGLTVLLGGAAVTFIYGSLALFVYHKVLKVPMAIVIGMLSGLHTQPAALVYSQEKTNSDLPNIGYATGYPVGMIAKIILAQVLFKLYPM